MKLRAKKTTTLFVLAVISLGMFVLVGSFIFSVNGKPAYADQTDGRLITVYDRGRSQSFITSSTDLKQALESQGIKLDPHDAVEPSLSEKLVASEYQVNIYRARPVIIIDGFVRKMVVTPYQSSEKILKDAGIKLYPEDITSITRADNIISAGAALQLTISRAKAVSIDLYGTQVQLRTQAKTIGAMLQEKNISLSLADRTSLPLNTEISDNLRLRVWREGQQLVTTSEPVTFSVKQILDADQYQGYKRVQTAGVNGTRTVTYQLEIINGHEASRTEIASLTTLQPVEQVEIIGTKPNTLPYTGSGQRTVWLGLSNISKENWGYADYMVMKESSWNPNSINQSSGACGLAQALPCSKVPGDPFNPVNSLNWMNDYVNGRYGGWKNAYSFWVANHWY